MRRTRRLSDTPLLQRQSAACESSRAGKVIVVLAAALVLLAGGGWGVYHLTTNRAQPMSDAETFLVRKGDRNFATTVTGSLQAERTERIRSKVEGSVQIIELIQEGTRITQEDVETGRALVKLDSSSLTDRHSKQVISVENSKASHTKASEDFEIQTKQNESNIRGAELDVKFARMELESYLGKALLDELGEEVNFAGLAESPHLGGAARQRKLQLESDLYMAGQELQQAAARYEHSKRLAEKKYISANELEADRLAHERRQAGVEQGQLSWDLFLKYELPKEAEKRFADWREKQLELDRERARANSQQAQALANLRSAEATLENHQETLENLEEQIVNCTIRATRPGLVVYASSTDWRRAQRSPIEEGITVRERQEIIHLPDLTTIVAEVKVHETDVKRIQVGQRAVATVDAYPDVRLRGSVKRVAGLPDPLGWGDNVKVFTVIVGIEGEHAQLRPGMSCQAEIIVAALKDVIYVPVQAVTSRGDRKVCFVAGERGSQRRVVETGEVDDMYVEIKNGLSSGERVLMNPPLFPVAEEGPMPTDPQGGPEEPELVAETGGGPAGTPAEVTPAPASLAREEESQPESGSEGPGVDMAALMRMFQAAREGGEVDREAMMRKFQEWRENATEQEREAMRGMFERQREGAGQADPGAGRRMPEGVRNPRRGSDAERPAGGEGSRGAGDEGR